MTPSSWSMSWNDGAGTADAVLALAEAAERADGVNPLNDQVRLDLAAGGGSGPFKHVYQQDGDTISAYTHVDLRDPHLAVVHLVVAPDRRREGMGTDCIETLPRLTGGRAVAAWAHGDLDAARGFATSLGWRRGRELRQLLLATNSAVAEPSYPDDVVVRPFEPGRDEAAWVEVNAAAFADHPEQGRMTVEDVEQREGLSWFDPAGFFLAERGGVLLGSHWTKVHTHDDGTKVGEVYVVGVSPAAQGLGLGKALTLTGVRHLQDQGLDVILYVDAGNTAAVGLYEGLGFTTTHVDVMYELPSADEIG